MKCLTCLGVALTLAIGFQADAQDQREAKPGGVQQDDNGPGGPGRGGRGGPTRTRWTRRRPPRTRWTWTRGTWTRGTRTRPTWVAPDKVDPDKVDPVLAGVVREAAEVCNGRSWWHDELPTCARSIGCRS